MKSSKGFTMIELLVALVIASAMMAGTVQMFIASRKTFTLVDQMKSLEENGRVGMDLLGRDVRGASAGENGRPIYVWDNDDTNNDPAQTEGSIDRDALDVLAGTDVLEVFVSQCSEPITFDFRFNTAATPRLPMDIIASCLPCYSSGDGTTALSDCISEFNIRINQVGTSYSCQLHLTGGNEQVGSGEINLGWNMGVNNDNANRPHSCNAPTPGSACTPANPNCWRAEAFIGTDLYYYVRSDDPDNPDPTTPNPQLIRYQVGMAPEVVANNVADLQVLVGEDNTPDFDGIIDTWLDGITDGTDVKIVKLSLMMKTPEIDPNKTAEAPPVLENSSISGLGVSDKYRRRVLTRTVRLRNISD